MITRDIYRTLGATSLRVSPLGLGTVKFGRNTRVRYPGKFAIPRLGALANLMSQAWELGINFIDTAPAYGHSEQTLGKILRTHNHDWVICTKAGEYYHNGRAWFDFDRQATINSIHSSLKLLGVDALDLVLIHSDGRDESIIDDTDIFETLIALKTQGKVRYIGMSPKTVAGALKAMPHADVLMITLNQEDTSQIEAIEAAQQASVGIIIKKALASGHSTDPAAALNFACGYAGVGSVIVGTIDPAHLAQNVHGLALTAD